MKDLIIIVYSLYLLRSACVHTVADYMCICTLCLGTWTCTYSSVHLTSCFFITCYSKVVRSESEGGGRGGEERE